MGASRPVAQATAVEAQALLRRLLAARRGPEAVPQGLVDDWQTFGLVFENLCMRDLAVYAAALPNVGSEPIRYYRDDSGLEADAVIELADGTWAAFELKVSEGKVPEAVASLKRLRSKLAPNQATQGKPPAFMAVITGNGEFARVTEEGIFVIPIRALTA